MKSLTDSFDRKIDYIRISVTDRCNFRCKYCMPDSEFSHISHTDILRYEEILRIIRICAENGVSSVRITGGEPLLRKNLVFFIQKIKEIPGIDDIALTTNASLLNQFAIPLKKAGVNRLNISIDSVNDKNSLKINPRSNLKNVISGIDKAIETGFENIKLNSVILRDMNFGEIFDLIEFARSRSLILRFIELMPTGGSIDKDVNMSVSAGEILNVINEKFEIKELNENFGKGPAKYYKIIPLNFVVGFITAVSNHFCNRCNRIRLTSDGYLRACLFSDKSINVKQILRSEEFLKGDESIKHDMLECLVKDVVRLKPEKHKISERSNDFPDMYKIGG